MDLRFTFQGENRILIESELSDVINDFGGKIDIKDTMDLYLARKPLKSSNSH